MQRISETFYSCILWYLNNEIGRRNKCRHIKCPQAVASMSSIRFFSFYIGVYFSSYMYISVHVHASFVNHLLIVVNSILVFQMTNFN